VAMLESYHKLQPNRKTVPEFKDPLQLISFALLEKVIASVMKDFCKQLRARVSQRPIF